MIEKIIYVVGLINTLVLFALFLMVSYHDSMFIHEWIEDHAQSAGPWHRQVLSVTASFRKCATERCRRRRRQTLKWAYVLFFFLVLEGLLVWFGLLKDA